MSGLILAKSCVALLMFFALGGAIYGCLNDPEYPFLGMVTYALGGFLLAGSLISVSLGLYYGTMFILS